MNFNRLVLCTLTVLVLGCSPAKEEKADEGGDELAEENVLTGDWQNVQIIVRMPDSTLTVSATEWEEKLGIKPIITTFNEAGGFVSEYRSPGDSLLMTSTGTWSVEGDSLVMVEQGSENKYYFQVDGDTVIFRGYLDWDQDGEPNDHYVGKQVRVD